MDAVLRAGAVYVFVLVIFRLSGRRTLSEMTAFDFVLLLIIGEATQQALLGDDFSVTNAFIIILTLVTIDIGLSLLKDRAPKFAKVMDGIPTIIVENGRPLRDRMEKARIDEDDVLEAARELRGLYRIEDIKFAVLEASGKITIMPYDQSERPR